MTIVHATMPKAASGAAGSQETETDLARRLIESDHELGQVLWRWSVKPSPYPSYAVYCSALAQAWRRREAVYADAIAFHIRVPDAASNFVFVALQDARQSCQMKAVREEQNARDDAERSKVAA